MQDNRFQSRHQALKISLEPEPAPTTLPYLLGALALLLCGIGGRVLQNQLHLQAITLSLALTVLAGDGLQRRACKFYYSCLVTTALFGGAVPA